MINYKRDTYLIGSQAQSDPAEADGSQFTFDHGLTATAATVSGNTVTVTTSAQSANTTYTVTVANSVTDLLGSGIVTSTSTSFKGLVVPAILRINEVNANIAGDCDLIELRVVRGGAMARVAISAFDMKLAFTNFIVKTNDFIVVHASPDCNSGRSRNETVAVNEQPAGMFAANFDLAYDWYALRSGYDTGLDSDVNVITLDDAFGNMMDAVLLRGASSPLYGLSEAAIVSDEHQWTPATDGGSTFPASAVHDLEATGNTVAGSSIQRIDDNDTNTRADWTTQGGVPSTWGALNPGQTELP